MQLNGVKLVSIINNMVINCDNFVVFNSAKITNHKIKQKFMGTTFRVQPEPCRFEAKVHNCSTQSDVVAAGWQFNYKMIQALGRLLYRNVT